MDQKWKFGGAIGYGDSNLEKIFCRSKVIKLHAVLFDAVGAVRAHSGKGPVYTYMIGRRPNSCLLLHVTRLLFCLYVLPSFFNPFDFWSSMSWLVLGNQPAEISVIRDLGVFTDAKVHEYSIYPPKKHKPTKQAFWCTRILQKTLWHNGY